MVSQERCLLAVFAHPDDESFGCGGTLAKYAAEGCQVHLVTATRGEAGEIAQGVAASPANLADVREAELRCACRALGINPPHLLGYTDGQLAVAHQGQAVARLVRIICELKPQVVLTFPPDGIYGHYDHIAVHRWASIAVKLAANPSYFPANADCQPHRVSKLYYTVLPEEAVEQGAAADQEEAAVMMDGVPFPFVTWKHEDITTWIDISSYTAAKWAAIRCHATQIGPQPEEAGAEFVADAREPFVLAHSTVGWPDAVEDDLFARIVS